MAQWGKCLLCNHETLECGSQHPCGKGMYAAICITPLWATEERAGSQVYIEVANSKLRETLSQRTRPLSQGQRKDLLPCWFFDYLCYVLVGCFLLLLMCLLYVFFCICTFILTTVKENNCNQLQLRHNLQKTILFQASQGYIVRTCENQKSTNSEAIHMLYFMLLIFSVFLLK